MAASMVLQVVVSPFLGVLFDNLTSPILKEVGLLWGVDKELKKLTSTVSAIQAVLEDAENKQLTSKPISDWLLKLKDAAYDADDILDEWATVSMEKHRTPLSHFSLEQMKFRHKIGQRMTEINQRFDGIASQRSMFGLNEGSLERRVELYPIRITSSIPADADIYGREDDTKFIVEWLLNNTGSSEDLSICSILGVGGLGKTTLAQSVFSDEKVKKHFDIKIWVCVSTDFDLTKLTRAVLDSIPGDSCNSEHLDPLQRRLQERLTGKRFLLVLDDVWNENQEEWDRFKIALKCGSKGSSAVVTTRLETVASITGTCPHYYLKSLSEEDCWVLFRQRAFGMGNEEKPSLAKIGKEIVKKCGGVPLAAKVLGGLMRFKTEESEWLYIKDSKIWGLPQSSENTILPTLRLSYTHLSSHLKDCFAYCSIFPQDFRMEKETVINLWMANGLFLPREGMQMEDIGNEIFNSLVWRSLFQVEEKDISGNAKTFVMHDLVHDLSCLVAKYECYNMDWSREIENVPNGTRHLSVTFTRVPSASRIRHIQQSAPKLRTLILDCHQWVRFSTDSLFSTFKSLRALCIVRSKQDENETVIPKCIGKLKHLRYLDLSNSRIKYLPKSICGMMNLQTLKLDGCSRLQAIPKSLSNISNLRHLNIKGCLKLHEMPINMGRMTCLQTLSTFIVGSNKGRGIKELERMDNLSGELIVKCLENVRSRGDAECANLLRKKKLETLHLSWSSHTEEENENEVIEGLRPGGNIRRLHIVGYQGICFPSWLQCTTLPNLVHVFLKGCTRCELPPSLGRLPLLKNLYVGEMPSVKFLFHNDGDDVVDRFASLEELSLNNMPKLEDWCSFTGNDGVGGGGKLFLPPRLKTLFIYNCPKLRRAPWPPSIESLKVRNCNEVVLGQLKNLPHLSSLDIRSFDEVACFPEGSLQGLTALTEFRISLFKQLKILPRELGDLSKLTFLQIIDCDELVSLPDEIRNLSSLFQLDIGPCRKLRSLPPGMLNECGTTLHFLEIKDCPNLEWESLEFKHLPALEGLTISCFSEMTSLPDGIQNVSSTLQGLSLEGLDSVTSLPEWIGSLTELTLLQIIQCEKLTMLPEGLRHLTNLERLIIHDSCPGLFWRCQKGKGKDWHKISHIPYHSVDTVRSQDV